MRDATDSEDPSLRVFCTFVPLEYEEEKTPARRRELESSKRVVLHIIIETGRWGNKFANLEIAMLQFLVSDLSSMVSRDSWHTMATVTGMILRDGGMNGGNAKKCGKRGPE